MPILGAVGNSPLKSQADHLMPGIFTGHVAVMYTMEKALAEYPSPHSSADTL